jgi:hypothetical protein
VQQVDLDMLTQQEQVVVVPVVIQAPQALKDQQALKVILVGKAPLDQQV